MANMTNDAMSNSTKDRADVGVAESDLYRVNGLPMPVCNFKWAPQGHPFDTIASLGSAATKLGNCYGFRVQLLINAKELINGIECHPSTRR